MTVHRSSVTIVALLVAAGVACTDERYPPTVAGARTEDDAREEQVALGARLFRDVRLSRDSSLSCATCHVPTRAFTEPRAVSHGIGARARKRSSPTLINVSLGGQPLDWDGRAEDLAQQLRGVFTPDGDVGMELGEAVKRVRDDACYQALFRKTYGREPDAPAFIAALVAFQGSLTIADSRFDRIYFGGDTTALNKEERLGWALFRTSKAGCAGCHLPVPEPQSGIVLFTDRSFHNLGIGYELGRTADVGRYGVTRRPTQWGAFRTPTLRNVSLTAPYMHDGSLATLEEVVDFYNRGGNPNPNLDVVIRGRRFLTDAERAALLAFLRALTTEWLQDSAQVSRRLLPSTRRGPAC